MHRSTLSSIGVSEGSQVRVKQGRGEAVLTAVVDGGVPPGVVRIAAAHASTCNLEGLSGPVSLEKA
jgi:NADH-quinone oxidoreductase subunit G